MKLRYARASRVYCRASSAQPEPNELSTFRQTGEFVHSVVGGAVRGPHVPPAPGNADSPAPPATVMIVDDERDIRFLLRFVLEKKGYRVVEAVHGACAVELIRVESPALLITDLMMPVMDGGELIEWLRATEETANVPAILVSACPERGPVERFDHVMRKPFKPNDLTAIVEALLARTYT